MSDLRVSRTCGVARIQLDRPSSLNALTPNLLHQLIYVCSEIAGDGAVGWVVLEGQGAHFARVPTYPPSRKPSPGRRRMTSPTSDDGPASPSRTSRR